MERRGGEEGGGEETSFVGVSLLPNIVLYILYFAALCLSTVYCTLCKKYISNIDINLCNKYISYIDINLCNSMQRRHCLPGKAFEGIGSWPVCLDYNLLL